MSIFAYLDYRQFLENEFRRRKREGLGFTQEQVASACGIRNTYLTNVLKGRGNFNSDQIFALAAYLKLSPPESDYLNLLKEYDQSISSARKAVLKKQMDEVRESANKTEKHISAEPRKDDHELIMKYYGDPFVKVVHVMLQIPRYAKDPQSIAESLNIQKDYLRALLEILVDLKIIELNSAKGTKVLQKNFHLPKDSPMLLPHQLLMRQKSALRVQAVNKNRRFTFSVSFSADESTREFIHQKYLEFLKQIEEAVKAAPSENAYQLNFDLFPWND